MAKNKHVKKKIFIGAYVLFLFPIAYLLFYDYIQYLKYSRQGGPEMVMRNYGRTVHVLADQFNLPEDYLFALIMLESSGRKVVPARFEETIYRKLVLTRAGKIDGFEQIDKNTLKNISKQQLKKLACSYGPFQLMGYKIFELNTSLKQLQGKNNVFWALKWIDENYGDFLRAGDYKNAFHIHNTGKKHPKSGKPETFDPEYVQKGLYYVRYYRKKLINEYK